MARAPLLQLSGISLTFGGNPVFDNLDLVVQPGDRVALVGRNGSGKSTLMKVMAGLVEPDAGLRVVPPGVSVGYMEQDPDLSGYATLGDYAASGLPDGLKVLPSGILLATRPGGVWLLSPQGEHLGTIQTGVAAANVALSRDNSWLYITASRYLLRIKLQPGKL